jgi:hypothetical protein
LDNQHIDEDDVKKTRETDAFNSPDTQIERLIDYRVASRSIPFPKKEALASGLIHMAGTLIVTLMGPGMGNWD